MLSFDEMMGMAAPSQLHRLATPAKPESSTAADNLSAGYRFVDVLRRATPDGAELPNDGKELPPWSTGARPAANLSEARDISVLETGSGNTLKAGQSAEVIADSTRRIEPQTTAKPDPLLPRERSFPNDQLPSLDTALESESKDVALSPEAPESTLMDRLPTPELAPGEERDPNAYAIQSTVTDGSPEIEPGVVSSLHRQVVEEQTAGAKVSTTPDLEPAKRDQTADPRTLSLDASRIEARSVPGEATLHGETASVTRSGESASPPPVTRPNAAWTSALAERIAQPLSEAIAIATRSRADLVETSPAQPSMTQRAGAPNPAVAARDALATPVGQLPGTSNAVPQASASLLSGAETQTREAIPFVPVARSLDPSSASPIVPGKPPGYPGIAGGLAAYRSGDGAMPYAAEGGTKLSAAADPDGQLRSQSGAEPMQQSIRSASDPSSAYIVRAVSPPLNAVAPTPAGPRLTTGSVVRAAATSGSPRSVASLAGTTEFDVKSPNPVSPEAVTHDRAAGATQVLPGSTVTGTTQMTVSGQIAPAAGAFSEAQLPAGLMQRLAQAVAQGQQSFRVALSPATLGNLDVSIEVRNEQTTVVAVASSAAARDALEASMPRLRQLLESSDLQLESFSIAHDSKDQRRGFEGEQDRSDNSRPSEPLAGHGQNPSTRQNEVISAQDGVDLFA